MVSHQHNNSILFCMITPEYFGRVQLPLLILKSYLAHKEPGLLIDLTSYSLESSLEDTVSDIISRSPSIVALSMAVWTEQRVNDTIFALKEKRPDITIIIGGNLPTHDSIGIMKKNPHINFAVRGEGEETLRLLLLELNKNGRAFDTIPNLTFKDGDQIVETPRKENYSIEVQDYPFFFDGLEDDQLIFYETSRGCKYGCKYCAYNMNFDAKPMIRYYPWEKVESDMTRIFELPKLKMLDFSDSTFIANRERGLKIFRLVNSLNAQRIEKGYPPIALSIEFSLEDFDDEILEEVKRLHSFAYGFGLQSIDHDVLRVSARRFNREKFTFYFQKLTEKNRAAVNLELMFGLPLDTLQKFRTALEYSISELNAHFIVCFRCSILPGSRFWNEKGRHGLVCEEHSPYYILDNPTFPGSDLQKAELLSFFIQLIYTLFRGIKKIVDKEFNGSKVPVYETLVDMFVEKYGDIFEFQTIRQGDVYSYISMLRNPESLLLKNRMLRDMRQTIKIYLLKNSNSDEAALTIQKQERILT